MPTVLSMWMILGFACSEDPGRTHDSHTMHLDTGPMDMTRAGITDGGSFHVTWVPAPDPIPYNDYFSLEIQVRDADTGASLTEALSVDVDAQMPAHGHGMNTKPVTSELGDGLFFTEGMVLHMEGAWELTIDVGLDGVVETARFDVECCD